MKMADFVSKRFFIAIVFVILALANIQIALAQNTSINGAWEMRKDGVVWVISFAEDTFVVFRNGNCYQYGPYTLEPSKWGFKVSSNNPQNLLMEFGFERSYNGFTYKVSANELVLSNPLQSHDGYLIISQDGMPLGTYKRSSEPSGSGNQLIGVWRFDYKDEKGEEQTTVMRFFPNGKGVRIGFPRLYSLYKANLLRVTYEFGTTPGKGQISFWRVNTDSPNWESVVFDVLPFTITSNVLRFDRYSDEYTKK